MAAILTLSVLEIILLFFGAVILGVTIHFTIASRRNFKATSTDKDETTRLRDEWKLRYFNDIESRDKELMALKEKLSELEENCNIYSIEAEEMRKENKKLSAELSNYSRPAAVSNKIDYLEQLRSAQAGLVEHNEKINQLLDNIDAIKEREEAQREIMRSNEDLLSQVSDLRTKLVDKEKEIGSIRQKEHLTKEMTSMLDNAYNEFNVLQSKMQKLELQVSSSKMINMEYEDLKESYHKMNREFDEQKNKLTVITNEHQQLQGLLTETEDKLRESNFQRQQLQKRVAYLEELNNDLQAVSDANKKLEVQLKRIGELESMLNIASEERDHLVRKMDK
jgi:chromosome segregation ATPase